MEQQALIERPRGVVPRIKSMVLEWLGVPVQLTNHQFWAEFLGAGSHSGERVTVTTALRISAVWACVRLLAETISTLPLVLYRRDPEHAVASNHPLYFLLHDSPNAEMTAVTFWECVLASMLLWGNAYVFIHRAAGIVVALEFILPMNVSVRRLRDGSLQYTWRNPLGGQITAVDTDMLHIPAFTVDGLLGLSPVSYAANVLGNAIAAERASGNVFRRGMMMGGTFQTPNIVPEKQRTAFKERLEEYRGSINAGNAPLLEAGITYQSIAIDPNDAQLLETRAFSIEEICRWYRVPPFMVGHSEKSTSWGSGIEQQQIGFLIFALRPWLKRVEQAVNRRLLTPLERRTMYCEFNIEALLRADSAARASYYSTMVQNGIYTRNEVRQKENLARIDGADELTAQVNLAPLSALGARAQDAIQKAAQTAQTQQDPAQQDPKRAAALAWLYEPEHNADPTASHVPVSESMQ